MSSREIKFRGRRVDNGEWIYGSLLDGDIIVAGPVDADEDYIGVGEWSSVDPETVGQYTGKQDQESAEVYGGDKIMAVLTGQTFEIYWDESNAGFMICPQNDGAELLDVMDWYEFEETDGSHGFFVVGSIHEIPSLLGDTGGDGG